MATETAAPPLSPDHLVQLGLGFTAAKVLLSAVELDVFGELARTGGRSASELAEHLGLHPRAAADFLDALVALGLLERDGGHYTDTPETEHFLDRAKPTYIGDGLAMANSRLYGFWGRLTDALHTGKPQNESRHGGDTYARIHEDPDRARQFRRAMSQLSRPSAHALAESFPWHEHTRVADIGCGDGDLLLRLLERHPHLSAVGFDLPTAADAFAEGVADTPHLADRIAFHAGDFHTDPLPRADVLVMGHVLHDWDDAGKRRLVARAHDALPPGGRLIAFEPFLDDDRRTNLTALLMGLNTVIETPAGGAHTLAQARDLFEGAGFRDVRAEVLAGPESMLIGVK